jgi:MFS transporter, DHA2 family, multidrug resistance protein
MMLLLAMGLSIPASLLAAFAPSIEVLFVARLIGGLAAGMAYPTTLALITALWSGPGRTKAIALWSGIAGAIAALGPLLSGALLTQCDWGAVFLMTVPLAAVALWMAWRLVPARGPGHPVRERPKCRRVKSFRPGAHRSGDAAPLAA